MNAAGTIPRTVALLVLACRALPAFADGDAVERLESELAALRSRIEAPRRETAGYKRGFFIASEDGNNELRLGLISQFRYIHNHLPEGAVFGDPAARDVGGFQLRRMQVDLQGHFIGPEWTYRLRLDASNGGNVQAAWAWVGYRFSDALSMRFGQLKPSFLHEENVSGASQLAAERSYTADYFTTDFSQGVQLTWQPLERLRLVGTFHSGSYTFRTDFNNDGSDGALTGRVEYLLGGAPGPSGWRQFHDFSSWSDDPPAILLGAAVDHEWGESGPAGNRPDVLKWTADANAQFGGLGLFGAVIGQHFNGRSPLAPGVPTAIDGAYQTGLVAQAASFIVPDKLEPFVRYEHLHFAGVYYRGNQGAVQGGSRNLEGNDALNILSAGANYYFHKHYAKLTTDFLYAFDPVPVANTGNGLLRSDTGGQFAARMQFQFRF